MNTNDSKAKTNRTLDQAGRDKPLTIVFFSNSGDDALAVLRILGPSNFAGIQVIRGVEDGQVDLDRISEGDVVVIQRDFPRDYDSYIKLTTLAHDQNKPVVMDLDDLLFALPENHPDRLSHYFTSALLPMLQAVMEADLLTVPTNNLRAYLLAYNKNIEVFQNYLNDRLWNLREPERNSSDNGIITIGYMGGHAHKPDLLAISPVLARIYEKYQPRIKFQFWGIEPPAELVEVSQVDWCPPKTYIYADFTAYFQSQSADIMVAPLADNLFNSCKSSIKFLEYSALGIPGVYSRVPPYTHIIEDGVNGYLASHDYEWEQSLSTLIEDQPLRLRIAHNAQTKVRDHWLLSRNAHLFKSIYENATVKNRQDASQLSPFYEMVKSLSRQIFDEYGQSNLLSLKNRIKVLERQVGLLGEERDRLIEQVNEGEKEILDYVLSTSWQITRPLRKISSGINRRNR